MKWVQLGREVQNHYQRKKGLKDKSSLPGHHKIVLHLASDLQKTSFLATVLLGLVWQRRYVLCWPELSSTFM